MSQKGPPHSSAGRTSGGNNAEDGEAPLFSPQSQGASGEGRDRKIDTPWLTPKRVGVGLAVFSALLLLAYGVWNAATSGQALKVDREKLTISRVEREPFQEFIAVTGNALPEQTVYLEAIEGGRIEEIYAEAGDMVSAGESIVRLSNSDLRRQVLDSETSIAEQRNRMEQLKLEMQRQSLDLQQQVANLQYQIKRLERQHKRQQHLWEQDLIPREQYLSTKDELQYQRRRLKLTRSAYVQDSLAQETRLATMQDTERRLEKNYEVLQESLNNLTVQTPIDGQLTSLNAEIGQIISPGTQLGQVDKVDDYKIQAQIDEFYIDRVRPGQTATTQSIGGIRYKLTVTRVYPEVENGQFRVDLQFRGERPKDMRRGQSVRLEIELSSPEQATILDRGGFYQSTGGNWAYVLTEDGNTAVRKPIRLGRQNPTHFEVLSGLKPGSRVVTSNYDTFGDAERLILE